MGRRSKVGLDNPTSRGHMNHTRQTFVYNRPYSEIQDAQNAIPRTTSLSEAQPRINQTTALTVAQLSRKIAHSQGVITAARAAKKRPNLPRQRRSNVLKRHAIKSTSKQYRTKYRRPLMPTLISVLAILVFTAGLLAVFTNFKNDETVKAQVGQLTVGANNNEGISDGLPSEDYPPVNIETYTVAADMPRFLNIKNLNIHARVRRLGVGTNNALKAPSNIFDVGWYEGSAKPGENGTVVINGHVSGATKRGVFNSISSLKLGDKISVERGDGKSITYSVTGSETYDNDKVDMDRVMNTSVQGKPALNLITCTGRFNVRTNQFEKRIAVFAVLDD